MSRRTTLVGYRTSFALIPALLGVLAECSTAESTFCFERQTSRSVDLRELQEYVKANPLPQTSTMQAAEASIGQRPTIRGPAFSRESISPVISAKSLPPQLRRQSRVACQDKIVYRADLQRTSSPKQLQIVVEAMQ